MNKLPIFFGFAFCILWICANHAWVNVFRWTPTNNIYIDLQKHKWNLFLDAIQFMVVPENRAHTAKFPRKTVLQISMLLAFKQNVVDDGVQVHPLTYLTYTWNILRHGLVARLSGQNWCFLFNGKRWYHYGN